MEKKTQFEAFLAFLACPETTARHIFTFVMTTNPEDHPGFHKEALELLELVWPEAYRMVMTELERA